MATRALFSTKIIPPYSISGFGGAAPPFTPASLSNLEGWYDASDTATITQSAGKVSAWASKANTHTLTQGTGAAQPNTGTRTENGLNAIDFEFADALSVPSSLYSLLGSAPCTEFVVWRSDNTSGDATQVIVAGQIGNFLRHGIFETATAKSFINRTTFVSTNILQTRDTNAHLTGFFRSGPQLIPWNDTTVGTNSNNSEDITLTSMTMGANTAIGGTRFDGLICEYIVYTRALTNAEINQVNAYLGAKWNTTFAVLPTMNQFGRAGSVSGFGDSITVGQDATTVQGRWLNIVTAPMLTALTNNGISGTIMQNGNLSGGSPQANNGRDRYVATLTGAGKRDFVFILYGLNDLRYTAAPATINLTNFVIDYQEVITGLLGAGYTTDTIIIGSPPWIPDAGYSVGGAGFTGSNRTIHETYVDAVRQLAVDNDLFYAPVYEEMLANSPATLVSSDEIHPNDAGHAFIANVFLNATKVT